MGELEDSADHLLVIGRGRLLADTSVRELVAAASGDRVAVRTGMRTEAMTILANAGAPATITDADTVTVAGLPVERVVELLTRDGVTFTGVSAHRASLEEAYMELTRDAIEFGTAASEGRQAP
jgi:ABC-2 type transport system ATP-binding protein